MYSINRRLWTVRSHERILYVDASYAISCTDVSTTKHVTLYEKRCIFVKPVSSSVLYFIEVSSLAGQYIFWHILHMQNRCPYLRWFYMQHDGSHYHSIQYLSTYGYLWGVITWYLLLAHKSTHIYIHTYTHIYIYIYVYICICIYIYI